MRARPLSVRARLTLWHAGVLMLIVCTFAAGILLFVKASLFEGLDRDLRRALMTVDWVYHQEPEELKDLASESGIALFQVTVGGKLRYQTEGWQREGLAGALLRKDVRLVVDLANRAAARGGAVLDAADAALTLMEHPR